jgi:predicted small secreted protein
MFEARLERRSPIGFIPGPRLPHEGTPDLEVSTLSLRKAALALSLSALSLASCDSMRRVGKDITITALSPAVILYGAATDAVGTTQQAREALGGGSVMQTVTLPFAFLWRGVVHTLYCGAHFCDIFLLPIYGVADLHPYGPEIKPLDFYNGTWFDQKGDQDRSAMDAQSGEESGK